MVVRSSFGFTSIALLAVLATGACKKSDWSPIANSPPHGRYLGVGIYAPGRPWTRMIAGQKPTSDSGARPIDDQAIIVVADSQTGELRACGDLTGYCIGMNPWKQPLLSSHTAPIDLTEHVQFEDPDVAARAVPGASAP